MQKKKKDSDLYDTLFPFNKNSLLKGSQELKWIVGINGPIMKKF